MLWGSYWLNEAVMVSDFLGLKEFPYLRLRKPPVTVGSTWKFESDAYAWAEQRGGHSSDES